MMLWPWTPKARKRRNCFHHEIHKVTDQEHDMARSFIRSELVDIGRNKRFWCEKSLGGCGQQWFAW